MDIFSSSWLIAMLAKSSKTPQGRLLSLFDILQDWVEAPNIHIEFDPNATHKNLIAFCIEQAIACKAANPEILAEHIILIARNALEQASNHTVIDSFAHAKKAAHALILAQTQNEPRIPKPFRYGIAASFFILVGITAMWLPQLQQSSTPVASINIPAVESLPVNAPVNDNSVTAHDAVIMYAKYEQMRKGTCQFPEALQIPDKHKAIYLENVVGGKLPTNLNNLAIANYYLEKVRCNFTPMLMANSR
jgi:hypothetical protein